ncbi:hypothetical protein BKA82DRAFT_145411 [Pisolithus tinctorius]|uniref:Uncharacterized protein n=1 Tax=Pisolithus tinctorius Marx 270 TaxID=870435 RepID=A0A0C3P834_PISTI|nr:hypothetical protein BKA82DRAFT_145411 [Pisolithus tinctorius]KIO03639.1 hypothetical protein M404DRAFT_145411 [Pisolithus tinctorius Marx 270]
MAFICLKANTLAKDLWPEENKLAISLHVKGRTLADWEYFPSTLEEMTSWATIVNNGENTNWNHNNLLVYKSPPLCSPSTFFPVSVHLFSFLQSFQIGSHGNWQW